MCKRIVSKSSKVFAELEKKWLQPSIEPVFIKVNGKVSSFRRQVKGGTTLTVLTELTWWHWSNTFSRGVPALLSVVCYPLRVGRKQDWNKILTKTSLICCCLPVFAKVCLCFIVGPHEQGSCQATIHVSYAVTITYYSSAPLLPVTKRAKSLLWKKRKSWFFLLAVLCTVSLESCIHNSEIKKNGINHCQTRCASQPGVKWALDKKQTVLCPFFLGTFLFQTTANMFEVPTSKLHICTYLENSMRLIRKKSKYISFV